MAKSEVGEPQKNMKVLDECEDGCTKFVAHTRQCEKQHSTGPQQSNTFRYTLRLQDRPPTRHPSGTNTTLLRSLKRYVVNRESAISDANRFWTIYEIKFIQRCDLNLN